MEFTETRQFTEDATKLIGEDGILELQIFLLENPARGDIIPNSGGLRKLRWAAKGKGKRGGSRVIYIYFKATRVIDLLAIYPKNRKENLTQQEINQLKGQ